MGGIYARVEVRKEVAIILLLVAATEAHRQPQQIQRVGGNSRSIGGSADSWFSTGHGGSDNGSRECRAAGALGSRIFPFEPFVINPPIKYSSEIPTMVYVF